MAKEKAGEGGYRMAHESLGPIPISVPVRVVEYTVDWCYDAHEQTVLRTKDRGAAQMLYDKLRAVLLRLNKLGVDASLEMNCESKTEYKVVKGATNG